MNAWLPALVALFAVACVLLSPLARSPNTFFRGSSREGRPPELWTLTCSQVTTWIFARSLLNAAILGFYYGIWGTVAYAGYFLSFLTGAVIIDRVRFRHGFDSIQDFLRDRFGRAGSRAYNLVVGVRLVSEVFANLLVIGILFGAEGTGTYVAAILAFSAVALLYSALGGLHASLRTDMFQMALFLVVLVLLLGMALANPVLTLADLGFKPFVVTDPGPVLIAVALLQVWSYPMHDPVMMDRGFLADRATTRASFLHAAWISIACILAFGVLGVFAGAHAGAGENMNAVLERLLGEWPMLLFALALVISAMSTLDSTLSSAAKLAVVDMRWLAPTLANGRLAMLGFMLLGLVLVFAGSKDLFAAVAVSGTAALYLAPVVFFSVLGGRRDIPAWSYMSSFGLAIAGALLYFTESSGHSAWMDVLPGIEHKYSKLLCISVVVLAGGNLAFWLGLRTATGRQQPLEAAA